jgi:hypothetical protein
MPSLKLTVTTNHVAMKVPKLLLPALNAISMMASDERMARAAGKVGAVDVALSLFAANSALVKNHATLTATLKLLVRCSSLPRSQLSLYQPVHCHAHVAGPVLFSP